MKKAWNQAILLLAGSLLLILGGVWIVHTARLQARLPREFQAARNTLAEIGGVPALDARERVMTGLQDRLEIERAALGSNAATFSRRVAEAFTQLNLAITTSSDWRAIPGLTTDTSGTFERSFSGIGSFDAVLDAVYTIESWPDRVRVRELQVAPEAPGLVAFELEIATVKLARPAKPGEN